MYSVLGIDWSKSIHNTRSDGLILMWIPLARTASYPPMSSRAFMVSARFFALSPLCSAAAPFGEPGIVLIPGGEYPRGRAHDHADSNLPYHLDQAEKTNEPYGVFPKADGHRARYHWIKEYLPKDEFPVANASWEDTSVYCACNAGKLLPSEAQWDRARRGIAERRKYSWGDREPTLNDAWFGAQNPDVVWGDRNRNYFGLCDMIGNVWEWKGDWSQRVFLRGLPRESER